MTNPEQPAQRTPRGLNLSTAPQPSVQAQPTGPRAIPLSTAQVEHKPSPAPAARRSPTDDLIDRALVIDPTVEGHRIRGRLDRLLSADTATIMTFGDENLTALQDASNKQARIASTLSQINAAEWIRETAEASCRVPGFLDRFTAKKPEFYQAKLRGARDQLANLAASLDTEIKNVEPDVLDLKHDTVTIQVAMETYADDVRIQTSDRRMRTLLGALQTVMMLLQTMRNAHQQCIDHMGRIDDLLNITIPNWIMANRA